MRERLWACEACCIGADMQATWTDNVLKRDLRDRCDLCDRTAVSVRLTTGETQMLLKSLEAKP
jgi:hypothetical protein